MELDELMRFARAYNKLGWSLQEQVGDIIEGNPINPNALKEIRSTIRGFNDELDGLIDSAEVEEI